MYWVVVRRQVTVAVCTPTCPWLVCRIRWRRFNEKCAAIAHEQERLVKTCLRPEHVPAEDTLRVLGQPLAQAASLAELLRRSEVSYDALMTLPGAGTAADDGEVPQQLEIQAKYSGYIIRQSAEIEQQRRHEETRLPTDFNYHNVRGLSVELCQKLSAQRPATLGQAARLSGVMPAAISFLLLHLKRRKA